MLQAAGSSPRDVQSGTLQCLGASGCIGLGDQVENEHSPPTWLNYADEERRLQAPPRANQRASNQQKRDRPWFRNDN